jgi:hypothetical protein
MSKHGFTSYRPLCLLSRQTEHHFAFLKVPLVFLVKCILGQSLGISPLCVYITHTHTHTSEYFKVSYHFLLG